VPKSVSGPLGQRNLLTDHPKLITSELPTNRKLTAGVATTAATSDLLLILVRHQATIAGLQDFTLLYQS
jgi:hypothetical protein